MEEGMQKECAMLIMSIDKELNEVRYLVSSNASCSILPQLRQRAQEVSRKREAFSKSAGGSIHKADLGDASKWSLGDVRQFGQLLLKLDEDLQDLEKQRDGVKQTVKELTSSMLKGALSALKEF
jgi:nucleoporin NUP159